MQAAALSMPKRARRGLLCCGAAAGPLFVSMFLIEGAKRPDYNPLRHPVSSLSLGPRGWVQAANFAITGMLYLAGAAGLARSPGPGAGGRIATAAAGTTGLGLLGSAAFRTDPVNGYPPGTPATPAQTTTTGAMHTIAALPVFLGIPAAALACAWRFYRGGRPGWAAYSAVKTSEILSVAYAEVLPVRWWVSAITSKRSSAGDRRCRAIGASAARMALSTARRWVRISAASAGSPGGSSRVFRVTSTASTVSTIRVIALGGRAED
jgi:hypothetical protein